MIRLITSLFLMFGLHYTSSYVSLAQTISQTNTDSLYFANTGHVGTLGDSVGDSTFLEQQFSQVLAGGFITITVMPDVKSDTLCDSAFLYQTGIGLLAKIKVVHPGISQFYTQFYATTRSNTFQPEQFKVVTKWKELAGKGAHTLRIRPNYIAQ